MVELCTFTLTDISSGNILLDIYVDYIALFAGTKTEEGIDRLHKLRKQVNLTFPVWYYVLASLSFDGRYVSQSNSSAPVRRLASRTH